MDRKLQKRAIASSKLSSEMWHAPDIDVVTLGPLYKVDLEAAFDFRGLVCIFSSHGRSTSGDCRSRRRSDRPRRCRPCNFHLTAAYTHHLRCNLPEYNPYGRLHRSVDGTCARRRYCTGVSSVRGVVTGFQKICPKLMSCKLLVCRA